MKDKKAQRAQVGIGIGGVSILAVFVILLSLIHIFSLEVDLWTTNIYSIWRLSC